MWSPGQWAGPVAEGEVRGQVIVLDLCTPMD